MDAVCGLYKSARIMANREAAYKGKLHITVNVIVNGLGIVWTGLYKIGGSYARVQ